MRLLEIDIISHFFKVLKLRLILLNIYYISLKSRFLLINIIFNFKAIFIFFILIFLLLLFFNIINPLFSFLY